MKRNRLEGLSMMMVRNRRGGDDKNAQNPKSRRSLARRFGARRRERRRIKSCWRKRRFSATRLLAPPGFKTVVNALSKCAKSTKRSFMRGQIEESCRWRQVDLYAIRHRDVRIRQGDPSRRRAERR